MLRILIDPEADNDLNEIFNYIASDNPVAARKVYLAAAETFERLSFMPNIGRQEHFKITGLIGMRMIPLSRFPNYLVFYRTTETELRILRLLHGARDLERLWQRFSSN